MEQLLAQKWYLSRVHMILRMPSDTDVRLHHRNRYSHGFVLSVDQSYEYIFDDGTVLSHTPGTLVYLPRGSNYDVRLFPEQRGTLWCINFYMEPETDLPPRVSPIGDVHRIERFFIEAEAAWSSRMPGYEYRARALVDEICFALAQSAHPIYHSALHRKQLNDALAYIDEHLTLPDLKVSDIAAYLNLSDVYLRRMFHDQLGLSPLRIIKNKRITRAKVLLESSCLTVSDIAELSGYACPSYFCGEFKRATGMTPTEYREHVAT